jgi:GTP-binding protein EngB required for normal cell division
MISPQQVTYESHLGRSNVGKSTLINTMANSAQARVSDKPGETRSVNWYQWGHLMFIVDLPGFVVLCYD